MEAPVLLSPARGSSFSRSDVRTAEPPVPDWKHPGLRAVQVIMERRAGIAERCRPRGRRAPPRRWWVCSVPESRGPTHRPRGYRAGHLRPQAARPRRRAEGRTQAAGLSANRVDDHQGLTRSDGLSSSPVNLAANSSALRTVRGGQHDATGSRSHRRAESAAMRGVGLFPAEPFDNTIAVVVQRQRQRHGNG
jgi:hypothetical protein